MVKAKGSWVTLDTSAQKIRVIPFPLFTTKKFLLVCLVGKFAMHSRIYFFLCKQTFLTACHSRLDNTSYSMQNLLSLNILHVKYIKWRAFSGLIQKICRPIDVLANKLTWGFFPLAIFTITKQKCKLKTVFGN